jgi:hypothetical protein
MRTASLRLKAIHNQILMRIVQTALIVVLLATFFCLFAPDPMLGDDRLEDAPPAIAWDWFATNMKQFQDYIKKGALTARIDYIRSFNYYLEERKIIINMGFRGSDKQG